MCLEVWFVGADTDCALYLITVTWMITACDKTLDVGSSFIFSGEFVLVLFHLFYSGPLILVSNLFFKNAMTKETMDMEQYT